MPNYRHRRPNPAFWQPRAGYILIYVVILIAMVAVLGAVVAPAVASAADEAKVVATYATLAQIDSGIVQFGTIVKRTTATVYPGSLHQLSTVVTTSDEVSCQNAKMTATSITNWNTAGPFVPMILPSAGLYTPLGVLNDLVERTAANSAMYIRIPAVDADLVTRMDVLVDKGNGGTAGTILYGTPNADGVVDMRYRIGFATAYTLKNQC